jgi:hypothetical protein
VRGVYIGLLFLVARVYSDVMFQTPAHRWREHHSAPFLPPALVCALLAIALPLRAQPPRDTPASEPPATEAPAADPPARPDSPPTSSSDSTPPARPKAARVYHLRLDGDLDCTALVAALRERLDDAASKKSGTIILELSGNRWRPDVVRDLAFALRESRLHTIAVLSDPRDHCVGAGALAIGLLAQEVFIERSTGILATPEHIARELAPESADLEKATRELSGSLHVTLAPRGLESLAWMIADPTREALEKPLYITPATTIAPARLTNSPPSPTDQTRGRTPTPAVKPSAASSERGVAVELSAADLESLGLATPIRGLANVAAGVGTRLAPVSLRVSLDEARAKASDHLAVADRSLAAGEKDLDLDWPRDPNVSRDTYQKAATRASRELDSVTSSLASLESLLAEFPELTRTPAPGQTSIAGKPSAYAARWKREAQNRADDLAKLREKARLFASQ